MTDPNPSVLPTDIEYLQRAIRVALESERRGNLPVGAIIVLDGTIVAEAGSSILKPEYHPGRHAEMEALRQVPAGLWQRSREMTCYTTLEPCMMCFGALLLHSIGRIVFGAADPEGGASAVLDHLPTYYANANSVPAWVGPLLSEECDDLYQRVRREFDRLPCGKLATVETKGTI